MSVCLKESINITEDYREKSASQPEGSLQMVKPADKKPLREHDTESLPSQSQHFLPKGKASTAPGKE